MAKQQAALDPEIFARTASLFAAKRGAFPPDAVGALATDIVRRLADLRSQDPDFDTARIDESTIADFCDALVRPGSDASLRFIQDRRAEGVTRQSVYLGYITGAARHLGKGWEEDRFSFLQVTIATGHLYALMRALRAEGGALRPRFDIRRSALFATVPGEDHGIGITVAADIFRDAGWEIDLQTATQHDALMAHVEQTHPLIIGLSLSTEQRLDALVRLVVAMRLAVPEAIIGVAPAATVDGKRLRALADIDLLFTDAPSAYRELDRLIRLRG